VRLTEACDSEHLVPTECLVADQVVLRRILPVSVCDCEYLSHGWSEIIMVNRLVHCGQCQHYYSQY